MAFIDYYKILGVDKNIPQKDVRAAYRRRAKQFHPDLHPNDPKAKAKFQALSEAFDVIGNPEKRAKYDKYGERWKDADSFEDFNRQTSGWSGRGTEKPLLMVLISVISGQTALAVSFKTSSDEEIMVQNPVNSIIRQVVIFREIGVYPLTWIFTLQYWEGR